MKIRNIYDNQIDEAFFSKQRDAYKTVRNLNSLSKKVDTLKNSDFQVTPEFLAALYYKQGPESPRTAQEVNSTLKSVLNNPKAVRNSQIAALKLAQTIFQSNDHDPQEFVTRATTEAPQAEPLPEPQTEPLPEPEPQAEDPLPQQAQPQQAQPQQAQPQQAQPQQAQPQQAQPQQAQPQQAQPQQAQPQQAQQPRQTQQAQQPRQTQQAQPAKTKPDYAKQVKSKMESLLGISRSADWGTDTLFGRIAVVLGRLSKHYDNERMPINLITTITKAKSSGESGLKIGKRDVTRNEKFVREKIIELMPKINPYLDTDPSILLQRNEYEYLFQCISGLIDVYNSLVAERTQNRAPKESYYYSSAPIQERMSDYVRSISDPEYQKFLSTSQDEDKQVEFANISALRNIIHNMILQYTKEADQALQSKGSNIKTYTQQLAKYLQGQKYASRSPEAAAAADKYKRPNQIQAPPEKEPEYISTNKEASKYGVRQAASAFYDNKPMGDSTIPSGTYIFEADWYEV